MSLHLLHAVWMGLIVALATAMGVVGPSPPEVAGDEGPRSVQPTFSIVIVAPTARCGEVRSMLAAARQRGDAWPEDGRAALALVAYGGDGSDKESAASHAADLASAIDAAGALADARAALRHVLVFVDSTSHDEKAVRAAVDRAIESRRVDTVNAIAIRGESGEGPTRAWAGRTLANSHIKFPDGWSTAALEWERNLAIIAQVDGWDSQCFGTGQTRAIEDILPLVLMRLTRLFGDYDGDGVVDVEFDCQLLGQPSGDDWDAFFAGVQSQSIFADWNFDGTWNGTVGPPTPTSQFGLDFSKFITGAIGGCP